MTTYPCARCKTGRVYAFAEPLLTVPALCPCCLFWSERLRAHAERAAIGVFHDVIHARCLYVLDVEADERDGPRVRVRWYDGRELATTRLRLVGSCQLPDNALVAYEPLH
jgi:hypothetical protein